MKLKRRSLLSNRFAAPIIIRAHLRFFRLAICVAQIVNLLCRRLAIGTLPDHPAILESRAAASPFWPQQVNNLRYGRLTICATYSAPDDARKNLRCARLPPRIHQMLGVAASRHRVMTDCPERWWRFVPLWGIATWFRYPPRRVECPEQVAAHKRQAFDDVLSQCRQAPARGGLRAPLAHPQQTPPISVDMVNDRQEIIRPLALDDQRA